LSYTWAATATGVPLRTIASEPFSDTLKGGAGLIITAIVIARKNYNPFAAGVGMPNVKLRSYQDIIITVYDPVAFGQPAPENVAYKQRMRADQAYISEWSLLSDSDELSVYKMVAVGNWKFEDPSGTDVE